MTWLTLAGLCPLLLGWEIGEPAVDFTAAWASGYAEAGTEALITRARGSLSGFQPSMTSGSVGDYSGASRVACPHLELDVRCPA